MKNVFWGGFVATVSLLVVLFLESSFHIFWVYPLDYIRDTMVMPLWVGLIGMFLLGWVVAALYSLFFRRFLSFIPPLWLRGTIYGILMGMLLYVALVMYNANYVTLNLTTEIIGMLLATGMYGLVLGVWMGGEEKNK